MIRTRAASFARRPIVEAGRGGDWRDDAACLGTDPEVFFPHDTDVATTRAALAICRDCPVREACLTYALSQDHQHGVAGGMTEVERRALIRARRGNKPAQPVELRGVIDDIAELAEQGLSIREIGDRLGKSRHVITDRVRESGRKELRERLAANGRARLIEAGARGAMKSAAMRRGVTTT